MCCKLRKLKKQVYALFYLLYNIAIKINLLQPSEVGTTYLLNR